MTAHSPTPATVPSADEQAAYETSRTDLVLGGRAILSGEYVAGLILAAQLDTAGTPRKLPTDLFPDADPVLVQEVWDRAMAVGVRCGRMLSTPRLSRDVLARLRDDLARAGHAAMAGMVARAAATAALTHPADGESARGGRDA
ncbi:hypothetical protein ACFW9D_05740 [Streptomyces sp. NPDC059524]|uniref:hypothetical protein n=1 Tax=Streptomyces sp. NPDC059524 TaxID=3346856 RepID=UPI00367D198A